MSKEMCDYLQHSIYRQVFDYIQTEGPIDNVQSKDIGNIGCQTQKEGKQNKEN